MKVLAAQFFPKQQIAETLKAKLVEKTRNTIFGKRMRVQGKDQKQMKEMDIWNLQKADSLKR